jgi:hypothetical protein
MYKHMTLGAEKKPMDHYTFMLEVCHDLIDIPLPSDYTKPREKEVPISGCDGGILAGAGPGSQNTRVSLLGPMHSWKTRSCTSNGVAEVLGTTSTHPGIPFGTGHSAPLDSDTAYQVRSLQESTIDPPVVVAAPLHVVEGRWRRRPNRRIRPGGDYTALRYPRAPHHSVRGEEQRKCRQCHKHMKWICPQYKGVVNVPREMFY